MKKWEEKFPQRVRERLEKIKITPEDRERIKGMEKLRDLLSKFYKGELTPEELANKLENKEFLIKEAQLKIIDSLSLQISSPDFKKRGKALLTLEKTKAQGKYQQLKTEINFLGELIKKYLEEKNRAYTRLKKQVEQDPNLRVRRIKTENEEIIVHLSPDEAVINSSQWQNFISQHDQIYQSEFTRIVAQLKELTGST